MNCQKLTDNIKTEICSLMSKYEIKDQEVEKIENMLWDNTNFIMKIMLNEK